MRVKNFIFEKTFFKSKKSDEDQEIQTGEKNNDCSRDNYPKHFFSIHFNLAALFGIPGQF